MLGCRTFSPKKISSESSIGPATMRRSLEGKGWCLFAKEEHQAKSVLGTEVPMVKCSPQRIDKVLRAISEITKATSLEADTVYGALYAVRSDPDLHERLKVLFAPDPDGDTQEAMEKVLAHLYGEYEPLQATELGKIYNAFAYNSFSSSKNGNSFVTFDVLSRISHSCQPNVEVVVNSKGRGEVVALTKICAGEELRISYLGEESLRLPRKERRRLLVAKWGFRCYCRQCAGLTT